MENIYKILGGGALIVLLIGFVWWGMQDNDQSTASAGTSGDYPAIVYYYGEECPHCQNIAKFLEENKIAEKVEFTKKEVWHNPGNNREMGARAEAECGLDKSKLGVPFLIVEGECHIGEPEVMNFFKEKAGIQ